MAAHGNNFIRVRLNFDYPPPSVADCRMCWLLVDLNGCRVVADLESVIREKFEFGRGSILSLFVEDCYLPHTESVYVVRDNDSVRVKVDCLAQANGPSSCPDTSESSRKRRRPVEEEGPGENQVSVEWKKKKRKKRSEDSLEMVEKETVQASGDEKKESQGKKKKKKKKKKKTKKAKEMSLILTPKPAASTKKTPVSVEQPLKSTKKPPVAKPLSSSDSSSSSSSEESTNKPATPKPTAPKPAPKIPSSSPAAASKTPPTTKPKMVKLHPPSSSSSDSDSSSDEAVPKNTPMTPKRRTPAPKSQQALPALQSTNGAQKPAAGVAAPPHDETAQPSGSDSDEEIKLVIRRPLQQPVLGAGSHPSWRGRARGQTWRGGPREGRGGGRGVRGPSSSFESTYNGAQEPSCLTDSLTNVSVVLQNGARDAPKRDYSSMPLLAAPPQVGQKIAFKLLELTENYTPEVSEYKEGKIVSLDLANKQIELELLSASKAPVEPGKFDLVYQNADGSESVEYAVSRGSRVTERWESLLEPRLII